MDRIESCFLTSLRCAMRGISIAEDPGLSPGEWQQLFRLATMHHVLPLVFEAVHTSASLQATPLLHAVKSQVRGQVILQMQKTAHFLQLLQELDAAGVQPLVVKGLVCRSLYPLPDHRFSSDEDLLIEPRDLPVYQEVFSRQALTTTFSPEQQAQSYEIPYRQPNGVLYIELHKSLFPTDSTSYGHLNRFFLNAHRQAIRMEIFGVKVSTLDHTDHLFYLICHALKHFIHSGFGIRQVCDIILYIQTYGSQIDWPQFLENCRNIQALEFTSAILRIGCRHLGLAEEACPAALAVSEIDEEPMLMDLLQAGVYGSSSESRLHSSNITLEAVASKRQNRTARNSVMLSLFPPSRQLEGRYPYLKDRPWLLPAAWVSRVGTYCRESLLHKPSSAADSLKLGTERIALLRYYGLLDDAF